MGHLSSLFTSRRWPVLALLASAGMLAAAHGLERFMYLLPCPLCLRQRDVYWAIIAMVVVGLALWKLRPTPRFLPALNILIGLAFLTGASVAAYHAGVEYGFWPAPSGCTTLTAAEAARIALEVSDLDRPLAIASCAEPVWYFAGLTMAGWNVLISIALAAFSFASAQRTPETALNPTSTTATP